MGRKSRLKREIKLLDLFDKLYALEEYDQPIYRFFSQECHADALCKGNIWISTLETCRKYENILQGDPEEATHTYNLPYASGFADDPNMKELSSRCGINVSGPGRLVIVNGRNTSILKNAFVLCTTSEFQPNELSEVFGSYCVEISNPIDFFVNVSITLNNIFPIKQATTGLVRYSNRYYQNFDPEPGKIGFIKPSNPYSSQKEYRQLWVPRNNENLEPFLLSCPNVAEFCKRVK